MNSQVETSGGGARGWITIKPKVYRGAIEIKSGGGKHYEEYSGEYEADALLEKDQVFETKNRIMKENMTFKGMKVHVVTNPAGGLTYYVGT